MAADRVPEPVAIKEDAATVALMRGLRSMGRAAIARFLQEVAGVSRPVDATFDVWAQPKEVWEPPEGPRHGVVIGVGSRIAAGSWSEDPAWGESRPDAVIRDGEVLVVFEFKPPARPVPSTQLLRHAATGALCVDAARGAFADAALREGFGHATWGHISGWLYRETRRSDASAVAHELMRTLIAGGYCQSVDHPAVAQPARLVHRWRQPAATPLADIEREWDLTGLRRICWQRYGDEPITATDCVAESERLVAAYERTDWLLPLGVRFGGPLGGMPPERVLSHLYGLEKGTVRRRLQNAYPPTWTGFYQRTVGSGADQHILAALLALTKSGPATDFKRRIRRFAPICWTVAPQRAQGLTSCTRRSLPRGGRSAARGPPLSTTSAGHSCCGAKRRPTRVKRSTSADARADAHRAAAGSRRDSAFAVGEQVCEELVELRLGRRATAVLGVDLREGPRDRRLQRHPALRV
jgi:hypothetical protein